MLIDISISFLCFVGGCSKNHVTHEFDRQRMAQLFGRGDEADSQKLTKESSENREEMTGALHRGAFT